MEQQKTQITAGLFNVWTDYGIFFIAFDVTDCQPGDLGGWRWRYVWASA